ncbi:hypothetical protein SAMD00020551_4938 [Mesobacillus selenatarsenatis SF-1]|uniref:Uncharacterized protein n=1 Tax=Mesobacillus selenatarsenatis (strain DSM 18680 / JCM 14380 / FERM P-15431 / SF-1) TaxID=1321606 RepID=A0A0A8X9T9_MESS1|nr:hypothetical protein SAMD00020551_4938 [Mesobacillus selenatarsenatis SF-1]
MVIEKVNSPSVVSVAFSIAATETYELFSEGIAGFPRRYNQLEASCFPRLKDFSVTGGVDGSIPVIQAKKGYQSLYSWFYKEGIS